MLGAMGPRAAAAPVALPLEIDGSRFGSSRRQGTICVVCFGFMETRHVELDQLPKLNEEIENRTKKSKKTCKIGCVCISLDNACLVIHFSTNQMPITLNEKNKIELKK